jgi:hypothetical protein
MIGSSVYIIRLCTNCKLGICSAGVLTDCNCRDTKLGSQFMLSPFYFYTDLIASTDIQVKCCEGDSLLVQTFINKLTDTVSLVCGDATGNNFCGSRDLVIWDSNLNSNHDLATSTLFNYNSITGLLTVSAS